MCRWNYMLSQEEDTKISSLFDLLEPIWETTLLLFHFFKWSYRFDRIRFEANLTLAIEQEF